MAIKYAPTGYGAAVEKLSKEAGAAVAAREVAKLTAQLDAQREAQIRSQQFQKQMAEMDQQLELEKFARSKAWDIEKMEIASRLDFQYEEKKRMQKQEEYDSRIKSLDQALERGDIGKEEYQIEKKTLFLHHLGLTEAARELHRRKTPEEIMMERMLGTQGQPTGGATPTVEAPSYQLEPTPQGMAMRTPAGIVQRINPDEQYKVEFNGERRIVPGSQLENMDQDVKFLGPAQSPEDKAQKSMMRNLQTGGFDVTTPSGRGLEVIRKQIEAIGEMDKPTAKEALGQLIRGATGTTWSAPMMERAKKGEGKNEKTPSGYTGSWKEYSALTKEIRALAERLSKAQGPGRSYTGYNK